MRFTGMRSSTWASGISSKRDLERGDSSNGNEKAMDAQSLFYFLDLVDASKRQKVACYIGNFGTLCGRMLALL